MVDVHGIKYDDDDAQWQIMSQKVCWLPSHCCYHHLDLSHTKTINPPSHQPSISAH